MQSYTIGHWWYRGRILASNAGDPGLICSQCIMVVFVLSFIGGSDSKESTNVGDLGSSLGWEDPLEKGMATHTSILGWRIPMDRRAWRATVHGVKKSQTGLRD